jgi:hypothetical protein
MGTVPATRPAERRATARARQLSRTRQHSGTRQYSRTRQYSGTRQYSAEGDHVADGRGYACRGSRVRARHRGDRSSRWSLRQQLRQPLLEPGRGTDGGRESREWRSCVRQVGLGGRRGFSHRGLSHCGLSHRGLSHCGLSPRGLRATRLRTRSDAVRIRGHCSGQANPRGRTSIDPGRS